MTEPRRRTSRFGCQRMLHIGDTSMHAYYARLAGLEFYDVTGLPGCWLSLI